MKTPSATTESTTDAGKQILSRFLSVDELLIRPSADQVAEAFLDDAERKPPPRIALVRSQELEQGIRNHPADAEPYLELAQIYLGQSRWKDALRVLDLGVNHNPEHETLLVLREESMLACSRQALDEARKVVAFRPTSETKHDLEHCELDLANLRAKVCENRYSRHPNQKELLIPWAIALRQLKRFDESITCLQQAAREPLLRARASLQLGMCFQEIGDTLQALAAYRRAALFRAPLPSPDIKRRALELAMKLATENHLIDSACRYAELLLAERPENKEEIKRQLVKLRELKL